MAENRDDTAEQPYTIRLVGIREGASQEKLIAGLQRLFKRKSAEEIGLALSRIPLVLSRSARKDQGDKIKAFIESVGGVIELTETSPVHEQPEIERPEGVEQAQPTIEREEPPWKKIRPPLPGERRTKPRVHSGIQLQPMGIGELLDRSFRLIREYFWLFFIIILIPQGIYFLMAKGVQIFLGGMEGSEFNIAMGVGFGVSTFFALVVFIILQFWAQGALIHAVSETYLGHGTSVGRSYGAMRRLLGRLLGTLFLWGLGVILVPGLTGIFLAILIPLLSAIGVGNITIGVFVFFVIVFAVWAFFRLFLNWLLVDKIVVIERKGWVKALKRSTELMKGRTEPGFWKSNKMKAGLILLLGFLIAAAIQLIFQVPAMIFGIILKGNIVILTILEILNIVGNTLATAFTATAMILYYYDIRLRKEGFDLKMMAENL